jgi:hypothetical protein
MSAMEKIEVSVRGVLIDDFVTLIDREHRSTQYSELC